ncbi:MAG: DNA repair protein RadA [Syntrophomonadaceae bacterium]|nr:DNA repair protein RadA [Syntrophomonadaceae bacterium]
MTKVRTKFLCQQCGFEAAKWVGRCPGCLEWNSLVEKTAAPSFPLRSDQKPVNNPQVISDVLVDSGIRYRTGSAEVDRVLGGGLVPGSLVLLSGDPGIGKSTLLLQVARWLSDQNGPVLYVTAEESVQQIALRASRLGINSNRLMVLGEADLGIVAEHIKQLNPLMVIIDSIQTVFSPELVMAPGTLGQVRESTAFLMNLAKTTQIVVWIVGHVTKDGAIAGPRVLEHMVDVVLHLDGERHHSFRILRGMKNRFGSTNESGILEMQETGLVDVTNPSEWFLTERPINAAGSVVVATLEGTRPLLVEVQALVVPGGFGQPRRSITGADYNRVSLILAVLEKRVGLNILNQDVFVNVVGGTKVIEPAADLGIALALASSFKGIPANRDLLVTGEIGLTGEIRSVGQINKRLQEAARLGFKQLIIPKGNERQVKNPAGTELIGVVTLEEALEVVFSG